MSEQAKELTEEEQEKAADEAFESGYGDGDYEVDPKDLIPGEETAEPPPQEPGEGEEKASGEEDKGEGEKQEEDPWAGVPAIVRERMEAIEAAANDATQIAKSAAGRANKLRLQEERQGGDKEEREEKPAPSAELLERAMTDQEAMKRLEEDWPDHARAMKDMATAFGGIIDERLSEVQRLVERNSQLTAAEVRTLARIDAAHPGWEETVATDDFKNWVFDGGPSLQERMTYEQLLSSQSEQTDEYFSALLEKYPEWAENKGKLYGSSSASESIKLLDMHKEAFKEPDKSGDPERDARAEEKRRRLEANIPATDGKGTRVPDGQKSLEEYLEEGFNG